MIKIYAPNAKNVYLCLYSAIKNSPDKILKFSKETHTIWIYNKRIDDQYIYYSIKVEKQKVKKTVEITDPYSKAILTKADYFNPRLSHIKIPEFDWTDDKFVKVSKSDLIIYETHLRDITAHKSSKSNSPGTYLGFIDNNQVGGINHLKKLGINAVEFLPVMEFGYFESPYKQKRNDVINSWNPYGINHWGYMTANFFSPTARYSIENQPSKGEWIGTTSEHINQFKTLVKELHKNDIAVIIDVVYNHYSEYEINGLKEISPETYFRLDRNGKYMSESFCGNDLNTENPVTRKLIIDSLKYWVKEFHIDGFRFDLANLIDQQTLEEITNELKKINPSIILIAEPWGAGYGPKRFSNLGWSSWNDRFRNGIKGENPLNGSGYIFGKYLGNENIESIKNYVTGTLVSNIEGLFKKSVHSVNYLASHDGFTLGDFIRISLNNELINEKIFYIDEFVKLDKTQLKINKFAALILFVSQGIPMIHSGQEFARSKVIQPQDGIEDPALYTIDHNSYEKDNETNYINYDHLEYNIELFEYYQGLIQFRKNYSDCWNNELVQFKFKEFIFSKKIIEFEIISRKHHLLIVLNGDPSLDATININKYKWNLLADYFKASERSIETNSITVPPLSGAVLIKK